MRGPLVDLVRVALLDDLAEVHHRNPVADVSNDREIVGDEQVRDSQVVLQLGQKVDHLRLGGDVEGAHRLVAHQQPGFEGQRPCDCNALALPAGELMGLTRQDVGTQPDLSQQLHHPPFPFGPVHGGVDGKGLTDDVGDGLLRVERRIRVLEDQLHRSR